LCHQLSLWNLLGCGDAAGLSDHRPFGRVAERGETGDPALIVVAELDVLVEELKGGQQRGAPGGGGVL
jgi:hypothetical protein